MNRLPVQLATCNTSHSEDYSVGERGTDGDGDADADASVLGKKDAFLGISGVY